MTKSFFCAKLSSCIYTTGDVLIRNKIMVMLSVCILLIALFSGCVVRPQPGDLVARTVTEKDEWYNYDTIMNTNGLYTILYHRGEDIPDVKGIKVDEMPAKGYYGSPNFFIFKNGSEPKIHLIAHNEDELYGQGNSSYDVWIVILPPSQKILGGTETHREGKRDVTTTTININQE